MEDIFIRLNVIDREGKKNAIDIKEGTTIRDAIEEKLSPDDYGICGGNCSCGTCHVYITPSDFEKLRPADEEEKGTLKALAIKPTTHSRLGCQIELKKEHNNITVTIAPD